MFEYLQCSPAYGRMYNSDDALLEDWKSGKDFKIVGGPYCSVRDTKMMVEDGYCGVAISTRGLNPKLVFIDF